MTQILNEEPLIWTINGNVPIVSLEYKTSWIDNEDYITFNEQYFLGDELVKSNSHVYNKTGFNLNSINNKF